MRRGYLACSLALAALLGCSDSSTEFWLPQNDLLKMVALDDRVAYVEKNSATAFVLNPADPSLVPKLAPVGKRPILAAKHKGSNRLIVLGAGDPGSTDRAPVPATLTVVDPSLLDAQDAPTAPIALTERFDGLAQSDDGYLAVLYHASSTQGAGDGTLFNPNQMAVLDFSANLAGLPTLTAKTIRSLGGAPWTSNSLLSPIQFSPVYVFQGVARRLAVVLSRDYVTLFDLTYPSNDEISIPLCPAGGACNYSVDQIVFDPSNVSDPSRPSVNIYIRAGAARDIYQVTLTPAEPGQAGAGGNNFTASISMLAVGSAPSDMALYGTGAAARLAVVAPDARKLVIIDPKTGGSTAVTMAIPASNIVPFTAVSRKSDSPGLQNRAMLVDLARGSASVLFADLGALEVAGGVALDQYSIRGVAAAVVPLVAQGIAVLLFGKSSGNAVLSVVTLAETPSFFDFDSAGTLGTPHLEVRDGGHATRFWWADSPSDGRPASNSRIHYQDLVGAAGQVSSTILLDQTITSITALAAPSSDLRRYLVLEQVDPGVRGNLTFLDANNPDRATARTAYGFLFTDYLGRTAP